MSGTPQKMLEHLLETRLSVHVGPNDPFLDDFLLTHIVFMPPAKLVDELANQYPFQIHMYANSVSGLIEVLLEKSSGNFYLKDFELSRKKL